MECARCGETITAPYFFDGKPFGWSCIKMVNPQAKKKKAGIKEHWVIASSSDFSPSPIKQHVTAFWNGRKFKFWIFPTRQLSGKESFLTDPHIVLSATGEIYINLAAYKNYPRISIHSTSY